MKYVKGKYILNEKDEKILKLLTEDGRMKKSDIGKAVGISGNAVGMKLKTMIDSGIITRFTVDINYDLIVE